MATIVEELKEQDSNDPSSDAAIRISLEEKNRSEESPIEVDFEAVGDKNL